MTDQTIGKTAGIPLARSLEKIFPTLSAAQIDRVATHGDQRSVTAGEALYDQGTANVPFFVLVSAKLQAIRPKCIRTLRSSHLKAPITSSRCYELNLLLRSVLQKIGFSVQMLAGRTRLNLTETVPKTHMTLLVSSSSGEWIADAGFGPYGLSGPVPFTIGAVHDTGYDRYRISRSSLWHYELQHESSGVWTTLYEFTTEPLPLADFEMMSYYNSTATKSRFLKSVVVACVDGDRRAVLIGRTLRKSHAHDRHERDVLTAQAYEAVLEGEFGIRLGTDASAVFALNAMKA